MAAHAVQHGPMDIAVEALNQTHISILTHMFNTAYFVLMKELPFTKFASQLKLQKKNSSNLIKLYHMLMTMQ